MDGPDLLAARLLRAMDDDDVDTVSHLVIEIEDSGYAASSPQDSRSPTSTNC